MSQCSAAHRGTGLNPNCSVITDEKTWTMPELRGDLSQFQPVGCILRLRIDLRGRWETSDNPSVKPLRSVSSVAAPGHRNMLGKGPRTTQVHSWERAGHVPVCRPSHSTKQAPIATKPGDPQVISWAWISRFNIVARFSCETEKMGGTQRLGRACASGSVSMVNFEVGMTLFGLNSTTFNFCLKVEKAANFNLIS